MHRFPSDCATSPRIRRALHAIVGIAMAAALGGCSNLEFPWVYRIDIDQGNIITQDMVNQLKPGMTRDQVKYVMGSPLLVDPFHPDRWDYVYTMRKADGKRTHQELTVTFKDDLLVSLSGDFLPASAQTPDSPTQTN
jgi:outer membrane protein assembly factor BamE